MKNAKTINNHQATFNTQYATKQHNNNAKQTKLLKTQPRTYIIPFNAKHMHVTFASQIIMLL